MVKKRVKKSSKKKVVKKKSAKKNLAKKLVKKKASKKKSLKKKKSSKKPVKRKVKITKRVRKRASEPDRIPTGVKNFDKLIEGGFEKHSMNLIVGGSGGGKTIFATQFLLEGMKRGEHCLYITFEEKKKQFYENMLDFGWDLKAYEKKGLFTFLEYSPIKVKTMLEEGGGAIESIILKKKVSRIVIDSITSFELLFEDELSKRQAALSLFGMIRDWQATALLTLEEEPSPSGEISSQAMKFEADSLIMLYYHRQKNERKRYLEVLKMRGTNHSGKVYAFDIGKRGVAISSRPVSSFK